MSGRQWQGNPSRCRASCTNSCTCESLPNSDTAPWSTPTKYSASNARKAVAANQSAAWAADRSTDPILVPVIFEPLAVLATVDSSGDLALLLGRPGATGAARSGFSQVRLGRRLAGSGEREHRVLAGAFAVPVVHVDGHDLSRSDLLEENLLRELVLDLALDGAPQRASTQHRVEATLGQQCLGLVGQLHGHVLALKLARDPGDHQVDHLDDLVASQLVEDDDLVDAVEELRAEVLLELVVDLLLHPLVVVVTATLGEAQADRLGDVGGAEVGGEDQHGVLEVHRAALPVGEPAILENLQQAVVDLLMRLLNLVEQHHRERLAPHLLGELAALFVADISRRGAEQPRRGESVMELAHVDLDQRVVVTEQEVGQRLGQLGLTHTGRAGEDERARR